MLIVGLAASLRDHNMTIPDIQTVSGDYVQGSFLLLPLSGERASAAFFFARSVESIKPAFGCVTSWPRRGEARSNPRVNTDAQAAVCRPLLVRRLRASRSAFRSLERE